MELYEGKISDLILQGDGWKCTCGRLYTVHRRFCVCGAEKEMEYLDANGLVIEFREQIVFALKEQGQ